MDPRIVAALAELEASRHPLVSLRTRLAALVQAGDTASAALGAHLFESFWHLQSPFADAGLAASAAALYGRLGRHDGARLLGGLAAQLAPGARARPASDSADADILTHAQPAAALLHRLELLDRQRDFAGAALLFERVLPRVPPLAEYWLYHRMAVVYIELGRGLAAFLMAGMAVQIEPRNSDADWPYRWVLAWFRSEGRIRDAALLCRRRAALCPEPALLTDDELDTLMQAAGKLPSLPEPHGRRDAVRRPAETRPQQAWRSYGTMPQSLRPLLHDLTRQAIQVSELRDAEVLLDRGAVAVFGADGTPHMDLSLRDYPALVRRRMTEAPDAGQRTEELTLEAAVLIADEFPSPNLCHFMLDHASRLVLYRQAGVDLSAVTAIGPAMRLAFQRDICTRLGVGSYLSGERRARLRVGRLWVSSTCRRLQHPAHWGADWAVGAVRGLYDLASRRPARRLLVSRADSPFRRIANEAELFDLLAPLGFERIVPGTLSFEDQRAAFRDATHVVAPHGQALANILFCAPGTQVLEAFHPLYGTWAYAMIAPALGLRYASIVGRDAVSDAPAHNDPDYAQPSPNSHSGHDMRIDPAHLRDWLKDIGLC